jgi:hypothetical protein
VAVVLTLSTSCLSSWLLWFGVVLRIRVRKRRIGRGENRLSVEWESMTTGRDGPLGGVSTWSTESGTVITNT